MLASTGSALRWAVRLALILLAADLFYLALVWPDWKALASEAVPKSNFIRDYEERQAHDRRLPPLRWQTVPLASIPRHVVRAIILAEDARFYQHGGFDLIAFKEAMDFNLNEGRLALGASTISQQTVKNLFLSASRDPIRKWHELVLTWGMEQQLTKRRILELYLNLAEFGPGIYGVEAAARAYWGTGVSAVSLVQAAELAASLPSPGRHNPATRTRQFEKRARKIYARLLRYPGDAADIVARELTSPEDEPTALGSATSRDGPPPDPI
jgi:monofunctional biosynthetic peptidoglycan transglycosylase